MSKKLPPFKPILTLQTLGQKCSDSDSESFEITDFYLGHPVAISKKRKLGIPILITSNFQCKSLQQQIPMPIQLADNQVSDSMRNICFSCLRVVPKLFTAVIWRKYPENEKLLLTNTLKVVVAYNCCIGILEDIIKKPPQNQ